MQCKNHPDRPAEHICAGCGIPICTDCTEEGKSGEYTCLRCAMLHSVSQVGTTIKDKRVKSEERKQKEREKKKWGPFQYFVLVSAVLILAMWGFILFGGQERPRNRADFGSQPRVLLFMVDSAIKRFAHYEGNEYPDRLSDLSPKYLNLSEDDLRYLQKLTYERDPNIGYRLSLADPKKGELNITISPKGIEYHPS